MAAWVINGFELVMGKLNFICDAGHHPTIYRGFMHSVGIHLVIIISYKHSFVITPVVPQHSCDGGREIRQL